MLGEKNEPIDNEGEAGMEGWRGQLAAEEVEERLIWSTRRFAETR